MNENLAEGIARSGKPSHIVVVGSIACYDLYIYSQEFQALKQPNNESVRISVTYVSDAGEDRDPLRTTLDYKKASGRAGEACLRLYIPYDG